jgi:hypothetical protein
MFEILDITKNNVIAINIEGRINKRDYDELLPIVEEKSRQFGKISMYLEFNNIKGVTPKAALDDIMTYFKYATKFDKIAVIGEEHWGSLLASTSKEFYSANIRYFKLKQKEDATSWINQ